MTAVTPTHKIIIVSGQEFSVPVETDNEAVRKHLTPTFPDLASADIKTGTKTIGGVEIPTVEFVKKAGTKGLGPRDLMTLLDQVPAAEPPDRSGLTFDQRRLLKQLQEGFLTCAAARALAGPLNDALEAVFERPELENKGGSLCMQLDQLPASAGTHLPSGW